MISDKCMISIQCLYYIIYRGRKKVLAPIFHPEIPLPCLRLIFLLLREDREGRFEEKRVRYYLYFLTNKKIK